MRALVLRAAAPLAGTLVLSTGQAQALLPTLEPPDLGTSALFGAAVAAVPDTDGDGHGDLLVGSPHGCGGPPLTGRAYLFSGLAVATDSDPSAAAGALDLRAAPNPARGATTLSFTLDRSGPVRLAVFDALGREVAVLADGARVAGDYEAALSAARLAPGLYLARLTTPDGVVAHRVTVVR